MNINLLAKAPPMPDWWLQKQWQKDADDGILRTKTSSSVVQLMELQVSWQIAWANEVERQIIANLPEDQKDRWDLISDLLPSRSLHD